MGRHFPVRESQGILNRLEKSGKITQNTGKLREFQTNIICVLFAKMDQVFSLKNKTLKKNTGKMEKILEKSENFVSPEKWEP